MRTIVVLLVFFGFDSISIYASKPSIYYLHVESEIKFRFAKTVVTSKVVNRDREAREATFDITLPNEAFITAFTLIVKGKEYNGTVKEKEQARKEFEAAKAKGQSAGHIQTKSREINTFHIQVNVEAKGKVTFKLTYRELLKRINGHYNHVIFINPGQIVDDFGVKVLIEESRNITNIFTPALQDGLLREGPQGVNKLAYIDRISPTKARISYAPGRLQQQGISENGVSGQFVVQYDIARENDAGEILVMDGYFVHFMAPEGLEPIPMDILFVLDKSGSMRGTKLKQMKESMLKILNDVREEDRIMIIAFDSRLKFWRNSFAQATPGNKRSAKDFILNTSAGGGTNINKALTEGINRLSELTSSFRAPVLVFLTDGKASSGITDRSRILENVKRLNDIKIPIFSLAFGRGADYDFVKKVAAQNNGMGRKIYEDSDAALQIAGFYKEISTVLMKDVSFKYLKGAINENTITDTNFNTYFKGSEMIVAGKVKDLDKLQQGMTINAMGRTSKLDYRFPKGGSVIMDPVWPPVRVASRHPKIMEKLWAYMTIKQLLKEKDKLTSATKIKNINKKILELSLKYQFVTPLTSMVVTLPDKLKFKPTRPKHGEESSAALPSASLDSVSQSKSSQASSRPSTGWKRRSGWQRRRFRKFRPSSVSGKRNVLPLGSLDTIHSLSASQSKSIQASSRPSSGWKRRRFQAKRKSLVSRQTNVPSQEVSKQHIPISKHIIPEGRITFPPMTSILSTTTPLSSTVPGAVDESRVSIKIPGYSLPLCLDIPFKENKNYVILEANHNNKVTKINAVPSRSKQGFTVAKVVQGGTTLAFRANQRNKGTIYEISVDGVYVSINETSSGLKIHAQFEANKSPEVNGLLGVFKNTIAKIFMNKGTVNGRDVGTLELSKGTYHFSVKGSMDEMREKRSCLYIERDQMKLFRFNLDDYIL